MSFINKFSCLMATMEELAQRFQGETEDDWKVDEKDARVAGRKLENESGLGAEEVNKGNVKVEEESGEGGDGRSEERKEAGGAGKEDKKHGVGESGENDEVGDKGEERESAETENEERGADEAGGEASDKHRSKPRRFLTTIEKVSKARREDKDAEKGGEGKLPAEVKEVGRGKEESESGDKENEAKRGKLATDIAEK